MRFAPRREIPIKTSVEIIIIWNVLVRRGPMPRPDRGRLIVHCEISLSGGVTYDSAVPSCLLYWACLAADRSPVHGRVAPPSFDSGPAGLLAGTC